ncbi:MAG: hypothetical protein M3R17_12015 [Bacteroidota bacterium]|nr:hypothetical protein [Bacteroidota bacterium]
MNFFEEEHTFVQAIDKKPRRIGFKKNSNSSINDDPQLLGIKIRLGNEPIVKNLQEILNATGSVIPPEISTLFKTKDIYSVVHAIGALRIEGNAKVSELQYEAQVKNIPGVQTIDLLPNTTFKDVWQLNMNFEGSMSANGNFSATIPTELTQALIPNKYVTLGGDIKLQLANNSSFIGKFSCGLKLPVVQSLGIASNTCTWILNPQENPLLGDQLLVQTIAVPKGTQKITYEMFGVLKADKGILWKKQEIKTKVYEVEVVLIG